VADQERQPSPLFLDPNSSDKYIYADEISQIILYRMIPRAGQGPRRARVPRLDYRREDGQEFVFDPFTTTEDDIIEHFGGGEYFIEALGHNGKKLPCGHPLFLDGPMKRRRWQVPGTNPAPGWMQRQNKAAFGYDPYSDDEDDDEDEDEEMGVVQQMLKVQQKQAEQMQKAAEDRAREARLEAKERESANTNIVGKVLDNAMSTRGHESSAVDTLKHQLEELSSRHRSDLQRRDDEVAQMRKDNRDEMTRKDRELEDLRKDHNREVDMLRHKHDKEVDDLRDELKDLKRRHDTELDEVKRRSAKDADAENDRLKKRLSDSEADLARERREWEKDRRDLEKEIYELQRDLADVPPEGSVGKLPANAPWGAHVATEALKWFGNRKAQEAQAAAMAQQNRQVPPPQQQQQQPPQQQRQAPPPQTPPADFRTTPNPPPSPAGPPPPPAAPPPQQQQAAPSNGSGAPHPFSFDDVEPFVDGDEDDGDDEPDDENDDEGVDDAKEAQS